MSFSTGQFSPFRSITGDKVEKECQQMAVAPGNDFPSFGTLLKTFRTRRHLTQQHLAEVLGMHRHAVGTWERGDFLPASRTIVLELARQLRLEESETRALLEASLTALSPHWSVPLRRNPYFTGREEILEALHLQLKEKRAVALTHSSALSGLGGVGKTQIALEYAYRHALEYTAVFWIEAETEATVLSSLLRVSEALQVPERQEADHQRVVTAVQRWLSSHSGWLLVWDNLEDFDLLPQLLPTTAREGAILLTTRAQALGTLALGMDLAPMEPSEGMRFVLRRAKVLEPEAAEADVQQFAAHSPDECAAAEELVTAMGGLPLALDQAGAYIEETGCGFVGYVQRYQHQRRHLLARRGGTLSDHPLSVAATVELACQHVARQSAAALELLRCCSCLHPDAIPEELFLAEGNQVGPVLEGVVADLSRVDEALATLRRFSLVQRNPETRTLSLHRLVQVMVQDEMSEQERAEVAQCMVHRLNVLFPESSAVKVVATWGLCERLLPHLTTCLATLPAQAQDQGLAELLHKAARYLNERGQEEQAELWYQRALSLFEQHLGPEHPQVGSTLSQLAWLYLVRGKYAQAEQLFQQAVHLLEQALGTEHPTIASPLSGLAAVYHSLGHYKQAEALYQHALQIYEQAAPEHTGVATTLNNLGILYRELGHYEQAEASCQRALRIWEQAWGPEYLNAAAAVYALGTLYCDMGHYEQAEPLYQRAAALLEQVNGPMHPNIAYPLSGLARIRREIGQYEEAESLYQRALQILEQRRGPRHPDIAEMLFGLALLRQRQGHLDEACSLAEQALVIQAQSLGETHPLTVAVRTLYTQLVEEQGCRQKEELAGGPADDPPALARWQERLPVQVMRVAVRGAAGQVAYTRLVPMREMTFTCTICGQTVTQLHHPSGRIKYCSDACRAISTAERHQVRVAKQREKRQIARGAR
jgi:tetratricopeptide (TPR) repeat protein